jgi:membrane-associated phospholipid phosphatase
VSGALVDRLVKEIVARPRPHLFGGALHASGYSFPSGHAMNAAIFCGVVIQLTWVLTRRRNIVGMVAAIVVTFTLLIGLSRIVLGVHYPTDVLGGYLLGTTWLACVFVTASLLQKTFRGPSNTS